MHVVCCKSYIALHIPNVGHIRDNIILIKHVKLHNNNNNLYIVIFDNNNYYIYNNIIHS